MASWTSTIEWQQHGNPDAVDVDAIMDALEGHSPALGAEPHDLGPDKPTIMSATLTFDAGSLRQANTAALQLVEQAAGCKAIAVSTSPTWLFDQRVLEPSIPELVGYAEIADMARVSRQRARQFADLSGFPVAVITTQAGPLRVRRSVEQWLAVRHPKPGRPAKVTAGA